mmetsp:Transcript_35687/g.65460  ORF Transcript_35687/g.65460 Transcript_35687/m.65460 type:complete len:510 (-) Transcript_35687:10-1539(-)
MPRCDVAPALGNFNIQYNLASASIAVDVLSSSVYTGHALYPEPRWSEKLTLAAVFAGAMAGMLSMGRLGDLLGRKRALRLTLAFALAGSILPAIACGSAEIVYIMITCGRLLLGIGVGGIYPLAAVLAAESTEDPGHKSGSVGRAFFWQAPGQVAPYIAAAALSVLRSSEDSDWVPQVQFRALFGLGALPALVLLALSFRRTNRSPEAREAQPLNAGLSAQSTVDSATPAGDESPAAPGHVGDLSSMLKKHPDALVALLGTSGTWFLYDIAFYGTNIFTPTILKDICLLGTVTEHGDCRQTFLQTAVEGGVVIILGVPGLLTSLMLVERWGCRRLNYTGFICLAVNFALMAVVAQVVPDNKLLLFVLYCCLNYFLNFGPNLGTYVLPAICFPEEIRSTCHGISAFGGKLGALVGALAFPLVEDTAYGLPLVLLCQALLCALGAGFSILFQRPDSDYLAPEASNCAGDPASGVGSIAGVQMSSADTFDSGTAVPSSDSEAAPHVIGSRVI